MEAKMTELNWLKELVRFEQDLEESGMVDFSAGFDPNKELIIQSVRFMNDLKEKFVDYASTFNELKGGAIGGIKIYGISNTQADFMLFRNGYKLIDEEPAPPGLPDHLHRKYGFSLYSARYGNIYTVKQLLQLAQETAGERKPENYIWQKNGKYFDALRPSVEPEGHDTEQEVIEHREFHIEKVKDVFTKMNLFIFTLGLTEMWVHKESGTVYPTAPGTICGEFDENIYEFKNAEFQEILNDFKEFQNTVNKLRSNQPFNIILTVSPVPLTATASGKHVLLSTVHSKSILRAVAGTLSTNDEKIDYFPSYEIVNNPRLHSTTFKDNLRSVRDETVQMVMQHFSIEHPPFQKKKNLNSKVIDKNEKSQEDIQCEEALLDAFAK